VASVSGDRKPFETSALSGSGTGNIVVFVSRRAATGWARQDPQFWYGTSADLEDRKRAEEERRNYGQTSPHVNRVSMLESCCLRVARAEATNTAAMTNQTCCAGLNGKQPDVV